MMQHGLFPDSALPPLRNRHTSHEVTTAMIALAGITREPLFAAIIAERWLRKKNRMHSGEGHDHLLPLPTILYADQLCAKLLLLYVIQNVNRMQLV